MTTHVSPLSSVSAQQDASAFWQGSSMSLPEPRIPLQRLHYEDTLLPRAGGHQMINRAQDCLHHWGLSLCNFYSVCSSRRCILWKLPVDRPHTQMQALHQVSYKLFCSKEKCITEHLILVKSLICLIAHLHRRLINCKAKSM